MWPFTKKVPVDTGPTAQDFRNGAIAELRKWRPIGTEIRYLGRTLVVTGHWKDSLSPYHWARLPKLCADYADDHGVLHSIEFEMAEALALMAAQP